MTNNKNSGVCGIHTAFGGNNVSTPNQLFNNDPGDTVDGDCDGDCGPGGSACDGDCAG